MQVKDRHVGCQQALKTYIRGGKGTEVRCGRTLVSNGHTWVRFAFAGRYYSCRKRPKHSDTHEQRRRSSRHLQDLPQARNSRRFRHCVASCARIWHDASSRSSLTPSGRRPDCPSILRTGVCSTSDHQTIPPANDIPRETSTGCLLRCLWPCKHQKHLPSTRTRPRF